MKRAIKLFIPFLWLILALLPLSCVRDKWSDGLPSADSEQEVTVELRLRTPNGFFGATRSQATTDESRVDNAVVLFFRGTQATAKLYAVSQGRSLTPEGDGTAVSFQVSFVVDADDANDTFSCVVLANVLGRTLATDFNGQGTEITIDGLRSVIGEMDYAALQEALYEAVSAPVQSDGEAFPMYGRTTEVLVPATPQTQPLTVSLLRDVARVQLYNTATTDFTLTEAYVYRASERRWLMPTTDAFGSVSSTVVVKPSVAEGTGSIAIASPWKYSVSDNRSEAEIYLPEADTHLEPGAVPGDKNHQNRCALVVGGSYKGGKTSYYRIDFTTTDSDGVRGLMDVLRNHSYNVTITAVRSSGEATPEDAYKSQTADIDVTIIPWEDENQDIVFDGTNWASVNRKRIEFADGAGLEALLSLLSNIAPSSWTMSIGGSEASSAETVTGTYFSVKKPADNPSPDATEQGGNLVIRTLQACPEGEEVREEVLHIYIARLELIVTLVQNPYSEIPWEDGGEFPGEF